MTSDDDIDIAFAIGGDPDDAKQRVIGIAASDVPLRDAGQPCPGGGIEYGGIDDEQVLIERRPADSVHGQSASANQRTAYMALVQQAGHGREQAHGASM
jgi:hypothetical protein